MKVQEAAVRGRRAADQLVPERTCDAYVVSWGVRVAVMPFSASCAPGRHH